MSSTAPSAHSALALICNNRYIEHPWGRARLLSLLQTNRALFEPAARLLWSNLDSLAPLISTLPTDTWTIETSSNDTLAGDVKQPLSTLYFTRELSSDDFTRYRVYAPFVEDIRISGYRSHPQITIHETAWAILHRGLLRLGNIHNFCSIHYSESSPDPLHLQVDPIDVFFGNELQTLSLYFGAPFDKISNRSLKTILDQIPAKAPRLRRIKITGPMHRRMMIDMTGWEDIIRPLGDLESFNVISGSGASVSQEMIRILASMRNLDEICVDLAAGVSYFDGQPPAPGLEWFPSLYDMTVRTADLASVASILRQISSRELCNINVEVIRTSSLLGEDARLLFDALSAHPTVEWISINAIPKALEEPDVELPYAACIVPPAAFTSLHSLVSLQSFSITNCLIPLLDDRTLTDLARALPQICNLQFEVNRRDASRSAGYKPKVTLAGLQALAEHCIHLTTLSIDIADIDASALAEAQHSLTRGFLGHSRGARRHEHALDALYLNDMFISEENVMPFVTVMTQWFPQLSLVHTHWYTRYMNAKTPEEEDALREMFLRWGRIRDLVRALQKVREQEQRWESVGCEQGDGADVVPEGPL